MSTTSRIGWDGRAQRVLRAALVGLLLVPGAASAASPSPAVVGATPPGVPSVPHDLPALEALLPDSVDGKPLFKTSLGRPTLEAMGAMSLGDLDALVEELGIDRPDLELAFANDPTAERSFNYFLVRAAGITGETLVGKYAEMVPRSSTGAGAVVDAVTIDGREVVWIVIPANPIPNLWFWADGDTLVGIQAADQPTFEKLYRLLPAPGSSLGSSPGPSQLPEA